MVQPGGGDGDDLGNGDGDGQGGDDLDGGTTDPGEDPDAGTTPTTHIAKDSDCDLNGVWIGRQIADNVADVLPISQYANTWYYLEFQQDGEDIVVSNHIDCGVLVLGSSVRVELSPQTTRALAGHNSQKGRKGTFKKQADGTCAFNLERFWNVRGLNEAKYAPKPRNTTKSITEVTAEIPLPTKSQPELTEDWDDDGKPGTAWHVSVLASGTRHSVQRDWNEWFSTSSYSIKASTTWPDPLMVRAQFDSQEVVFEPTSGLLTSGSKPNGKSDHTFTMKFLGRDTQDARVKAIVKSDVFDTCRNIQAALPGIQGLK